MFDFLKKAEDKADVAKTSAKLLDVATHFLIVPAKKRIYVWCYDENVEKVKKIFGSELIKVKKLRGRMSLVIGTY